jgi:putative intracellular protease/amidase
LIGGPDPSKAHPKSLEFLRQASKQTKVILTTCTGGMWLAASGALDGKKATTNRASVESAKTFFPKVEWVDARWVIEKGHFEGAEIWTAGGAGCGKWTGSEQGVVSASLILWQGIDMFAEYVRKHFDPTLAGLSLSGLDFVPEQTHGQFYTEPLATLYQG